MFGLGTYLCVQYDFLVFTHEFVSTVRKPDKDEDILDYSLRHPDFIPELKETIREIPTLPIDRKSVIMGTVWTFPRDSGEFCSSCISRLVNQTF